MKLPVTKLRIRKRLGGLDIRFMSQSPRGTQFASGNVLLVSEDPGGKVTSEQVEQAIRTRASSPG